MRPSPRRRSAPCSCWRSMFLFRVGRAHDAPQRAQEEEREEQQRQIVRAGIHSSSKSLNSTHVCGGSAIDGRVSASKYQVVPRRRNCIRIRICRLATAGAGQCTGAAAQVCAGPQARDVMELQVVRQTLSTTARFTVACTTLFFASPTRETISARRAWDGLDQHAPAAAACAASALCMTGSDLQRWSVHRKTCMPVDTMSMSFMCQ